MKMTVYKCDHCKKVLSDNASSVSHIAIKGEILRPTVCVGMLRIAPPDCWHKKGEFQFCGTECLVSWILNELAEFNEAH